MSDFKILTDEQHLILRKGMYLSSDNMTELNGYVISTNKTSYEKFHIVPAFCKIINEVVDNSVDEYIRTSGKFATKINVSMKLTIDGVEISIVDSGRGIPCKLVEGTDEYQAVACFTRSRAGTSFDNDRVSAGANGMGVFLTHTLSNYFTAETHDGENKLTYQKPNYVKIEPSKKRGTTVTFVPDLTHFNFDLNKETFDAHCDFIRQRLINLSICYPKINFMFNGENVSIKDVSIVANTISTEHVIHKTEKYSLIIASTAEFQEFRQHCYANGLYNINGGAIIDYVASQLSSALIPLIKKKYKIEVSLGQIKNNLFIGFFGIDFVNLKFDSQTKERVTNSAKEVSDYFSYDFNILAKKVIQSEAIIDPIVKAILFKKAQAENLELARQQKKLKTEKVVNHIPANHNKRSECSLYITEGQSSVGFFLSARGSNKLGLYSLQGKIDNVSKLTPNEIVNVKVLKELISVVGLQLNKPPTNTNYGQIIFATDADVDGSSIAMLLINFFSLWGEEIFDRIYRVLPPLYSASKKGQPTKYYYSQEDFEKAQNSLKGYNCLYIKGLGQMSENAYADMINNPILVKIMWDGSAKKYLEMLFGKDEQKRKDWLLTGDFK